MEFYKSTSGRSSELTLIGSKRIMSFGRYYAHHPEKFSDFIDELLPITPSHTVVQRPFGKPGSILQFLILKSDLRLAEENKYSIVHILEFAHKLMASHTSQSGKTVLCYVFNNKILILASKMHEISFSRIYNYVSSEDILYHVHACVKNIFRGEPNIQIVLTGEISMDSKITNGLKRYFPELLVVPVSPDQL